MRSTKCIILVCVLFLQPLKCNAIHWKEFHVVWDTVIILYSFNSCPASRGASLLCPQKQCLSGKIDRLSGRTNQRHPCVKGADAGGGWGIVLRWIFCFYNPSVSLARATSLYTREAHHRPTVHLKGVTHYTLRGKACEKRTENFYVLCPFP